MGMSGAKLWERARHVGKAKKMQNRADDMIEQVGDTISSFTKKVSWAKLLGRAEAKVEDASDGAGETGEASTPAEESQPTNPAMKVNPLLVRMRSAGMLKKTMSTVVKDAAALEKKECKSKSVTIKENM